MNKVTEFLKACGTFYFATVDGDKARVRPFGAVSEYEGRTYFCTNNTKACFKQMIANPNVEICGCKGRDWIRISGKAVADPRDEARAAFLEASPNLGRMYKVGDGIFEVFYITDGTATIIAADGKGETILL